MIKPLLISLVVEELFHSVLTSTYFFLFDWTVSYGLSSFTCHSNFLYGAFWMHGVGQRLFKTSFLCDMWTIPLLYDHMGGMLWMNFYDIWMAIIRIFTLQWQWSVLRDFLFWMCWYTKGPWEGTVGRRVYRKPTQTALYLNGASHQHPAQKHGVLSTRIHRMLVVSDVQNLARELHHLLLSLPA